MIARSADRACSSHLRMRNMSYSRYMLLMDSHMRRSPGGWVYLARERADRSSADSDCVSRGQGMKSRFGDGGLECGARALLCEGATMTFTFDESRFRSLWRSTEETLQLRQRLDDVLKSRDVSSFD